LLASPKLGISPVSASRIASGAIGCHRLLSAAIGCHRLGERREHGWRELNVGAAEVRSQPDAPSAAASDEDSTDFADARDTADIRGRSASLSACLCHHSARASASVSESGRELATPACNRTVDG
jgi:hypothetical protein